MSSGPSNQAGFLPPFELRRLIRPVFAPDLINSPEAHSLPPQPGPSKNPVIRSVDGHGQLLWVGSNDGRVKGLDIKAHPTPSRLVHNRVASDVIRASDPTDPQPRPHSVSGRLSSKPSSPRQSDDGSTLQEDIIDTSCFQDCHAWLSFYQRELSHFIRSRDLQPCSSSSFPFIRGVSAVTLDEHTYNQNDPQSSNQANDVLMCVIKKKSIFLCLLSMNGVRQVHEVAFASTARSDATLPISQSSVPVSEDPTIISSQATRHRPSMAAIPRSQEFLLASHTGSTCLGIFVSSSGEPSRGTLEWPSNPRSVAVDSNHVFGSPFQWDDRSPFISNSELVQVISLPDGLDPRSLGSAKFGISLPGESYTTQLNTVPFSWRLAHHPAVPKIPSQRRGDPRIFLRLFPLLVAHNLSKSDTVRIFSGLEDMVREIKSAEELITINLVRNYSPHIKPDIDTALPTVDLKAQLHEKARQVLLRYLTRWRRDRLLKGGASDSNRHLDSIIDTSVVQLLSERRQVDHDAYANLRQILERPNSCVFAEIEPVLLQSKCFCILAEIYLKRQLIPEAFDIWAKLYDKVYEDDDFRYDLNRMALILLQHEDVEFVFQYATWMAPLNRNLAVKILVESKVSRSINVDRTFENLQEVSPEAAEFYLEEIISRESREGAGSGKRKTAGSSEEEQQITHRLADLQTKLILGYLSRLKGLLRSTTEEGSSLTMGFFRGLVEDFIRKASNEDLKPQSFIDFLLQVSPPAVDDQTSSQISNALSTRARLLLCLDHSDHPDQPNHYDAQQIRSVIEDMGGSAELLAVERAMVYSKLGLHRPALSLLALTLKDTRSAETYCLQNGTILSPVQMTELGLKGGISTTGGIGKRVIKNERTETTDSLIGILFDLLIDSSVSSGLQVRLLLSRHAARIPLDSTLERLPENWPLDPILIAPYLSRTLRKSCHLNHEASIVKAIALGHHISIAVACDDLLSLRNQKKTS
ncbi:hypothetical protein PSTT_00013 [Puccinia striiformis]|uniref:Vacuolar sorting protein 39/Transforming growth factor beta receptor-associated domain-containing protein n=1 Tax=Puccinia striiformis TaxID=27350 RepID=A0A2S4W854_9BASI|nr:hypothetical protein PSTT_00013 [Puccinia striiformis]